MFKRWLRPDESLNQRMARLLGATDTGPKLRGPVLTQPGRSMLPDADMAATHHTRPDSLESVPICYLPFVIHASPELPQVFVPGRGDVIPHGEVIWLSDEGFC